ncbi:hypothetical protein [Haloglomus litoreum]|uniref:DUF7845 domain-containing protein n=1 Tax=Haloglomus litoreum TaxID=3034026 RepID=UPI0023E7BA62|nr:hypothetical protein [Haloglomus sp. DT116]
MALVETAPHEVKGHLVYTEHGASPYWLLGKLLIEGHGGYVGNLEVPVDGETWEVMLTDTDGGLAPREEDPVDEPLNEWQLKARGAGEHNRRKVTFEVKPRWSDMESWEGQDVNTPFDHDDGPDEGVAVHFQGSNIEPDAYPGLLWEFVQGLAEAAGMQVSPHYFAALHDWSSIYEYERYVRVRRGMAKKYISNDGIMRRLLMLCADERGSKAELKLDNEDVVGYNHRLILPRADAQRLIDGHTAGKQLKHYHPKHVRDSEDDGADEDPLYHPKVGALARKSLDGSAWSWSDRHDLGAELEESILNTLRWSGIPVRPDATTFIADDHFEPAATDRNVRLYDDPTPEVEAQQEALVVTALRQMTDADVDLVERLVEDGEGQDYRELADGAGHSVSTLYRALERMGDILRSDDGEIRFGSRKIAQEIRGIVESTEHHIRNAADRASQLVTMNQQRAESSAFQQWLNEYAVEVLQRKDDGRVRVRIDTVLSDLKADHYPTIREALLEGYSAWVQDGHDAAAFREMLVQWSNRGDATTSKPGVILDSA